MMSLTEIKKIIRPNILNLKAYSSARDEYKQNVGIFLDANENPFKNGVNRYPDPYQVELKSVVAKLKNINAENILLGNGSDEVIDIVVRTFCEPAKDNIIICPPTYGMYKVIANVNDVTIKEVYLNSDFSINENEILEVADAKTKMIILCSPNNPTGNTIQLEKIEFLLQNFKGIVLVDEAYIDFCIDKSVAPLLKKYTNLIVSQTLSKAWAMAGLRVGILLADKNIISVFNKVKPPYNISELSQQKAIQILEDTNKFQGNLKQIDLQKEKLIDFLKKTSLVTEFFLSEANFVSARFKNANRVYSKLVQKGIVVRNRSNQVLCEGCLRITIGTKKENERLINCLKDIEDE